GGALGRWAFCWSERRKVVPIVGSAWARKRTGFAVLSGITPSALPTAFLGAWCLRAAVAGAAIRNRTSNATNGALRHRRAEDIRNSSHPTRDGRDRARGIESWRQPQRKSGLHGASSPRWAAR